MPKIRKPNTEKKEKAKEYDNPYAPVSDEEAEEISDRSTFENFNPEDKNGFTQQNTNCYLVKGESADFVFLTRQFFKQMTHSTVKTTKNGTKIYPKELCRINVGDKDCPYCDESKHNESVKGKYESRYWEVIDFRGQKEKEGEKWVYTNTPAPKLFMGMSTALATQIRVLRDEVEEDDIELHEVIITITRQKDGSYTSGVKTKKLGRGKSETIVLDSEIERDRKGLLESCKIAYADGDDIYNGYLPHVPTILAPKSVEQMEKDLSY